MLYPALWAYRTAVKTTTGFSPYKLVHGVESILSVECEIPSLKIAIEVLLDYYGEKFLWLGVPQQTARLQKSIFPNMQ